MHVCDHAAISALAVGTGFNQLLLTMSNGVTAVLSLERDMMYAILFLDDTDARTTTHMSSYGILMLRAPSAAKLPSFCSMQGRNGITEFRSMKLPIPC